MLTVPLVSGMHHRLYFLYLTFVTSLNLNCNTNLPQWHSYWIKYQNLKLAHSTEKMNVFRETLYHLVLSNHTAILECNVGVIAGYFLIGERALEESHELAYRSFQMAMIFVYTLRFTRQRIPITSEIEWSISRDKLVQYIVKLKSNYMQKFQPVPYRISSPQNVKIAIVSICAYPVGSKLILKEVTPINRKRYADKHGYTAFVFLERPLGQNSTVSIQHSKLEVMRLLMESGQFEWLMWTDCDSIIVNQDRKIEDILSQYADNPVTSLLITEEMLGLSSANWIIRSSSWSVDFLAKAFEIAHRELPLFGDQDAMISLAIGRGSLDPHIAIIPQNEINAYDALNAFIMGSGGYKTGDLLVTFPQCQGSSCNVLFYEAFKASEDNGKAMEATSPAARTEPQLRVFGPPEVIGNLYFQRT